MKEEALKLADLMIDVTDCETSEFYRAGQMIRRLVEELDKKNEPVASWLKMGLPQAPQTKPLSDEEMKELINNFPIIFSPQDLLSFARAIEERHGIK